MADDALASPFSSLGLLANKENGENCAACWQQLERKRIGTHWILLVRHSCMRLIVPQRPELPEEGPLLSGTNRSI